jgi:Holliday junction resolvase
MRLRAKTDVNQKAVVEQLRAIGATVAITSQLGKGFPDIVVGYGGDNYLFEIKDQKKTPSERKLTKDEQKFNDSWEGQYAVIETAAQALKIMGVTGC